LAGSRKAPPRRADPPAPPPAGGRIGAYLQHHWHDVRDILLFFCGLAGVVHETLLTNAERPALLVLFAAMMGLPAFLRADKGPPSG